MILCILIFYFLNSFKLTVYNICLLYPKCRWWPILMRNSMSDGNWRLCLVLSAILQLWQSQKHKSARSTAPNVIRSIPFKLKIKRKINQINQIMAKQQMRKIIFMNRSIKILRKIKKKVILLKQNNNKNKKKMSLNSWKLKSSLPHLKNQMMFPKN